MIRSLVFFILLISLTTRGQEASDTTLVRLQNELRNAETDSIKINRMLALAELQYDRDFSTSEQLVDEALTLIREQNKEPNIQQLAKAYVIKGVINRREGDYPKALEYYFRAKELYESVEDTWHVSDIYHNMGMLYRYQKSHGKAIRLYKQSIEIKEPLRDTHGIAAGYNMMGVSYRQSKQLDSALYYYTKAKSLFQTIHSIGDIQRVNNNLGALYRELGNIEEALRLGLENVVDAKENRKIYSLCTAYYNLSTIYKRNKSFDRSLIYVDSSLQIANQHRFRDRIAKGYLRKSYLYAQIGDYKEAYNHYRTFNRHSDSIFNIENVKKIQALELNHQFNQEKLADSLAFEQETREVRFLTEVEKSKKRLYLVLLIVSVVSMLLIVVLLRRNYSNKVRVAEEILEKEKAQKKLLDQQLIAKEEEIKRLVADNTMRLRFKEELLSQLKKELTEKKPEELKVSLSSLTQELKSQITTEGKFSNLNRKIDEVNQGFNAKLIQLYPQLTKTEREVCALLRLNLSIKEIMTIRNASLDAIKSTRYRIRKKIGLAPKEELEQFIQSL